MKISDETFYLLYPIAVILVFLLIGWLDTKIGP